MIFESSKDTCSLLVSSGSSSPAPHTKFESEENILAKIIAQVARS